MRGTRVLSFGFGAVLLCVSGCWETESNLRPPKQPEEYRLPPDDDSRFSSPPAYPKGTLNQDFIKKDKEREENNKPNFPASRSGPSMSGGGGY